MTTLIFSGTIEEAKAYAQLHALPRGSTGYIGSRIAAQGIRNRVVLLVGTWHQRADAHDVLQQLHEQGCTLRAVEARAAIKGDALDTG